MKKIPKYWYVLYKNYDEYNELRKWFKITLYNFEDRINGCGFCNLPTGEWFDSKYESDINNAKKYNAVQLSFEEWQELICGIKPTSTKLNLNKLLNILKFINNYGRI